MTDHEFKVTFSIKKRWKFLPGVSKPESKWKVDTRESNKAHNATNRKKKFQPHWLQMYK